MEKAWFWFCSIPGIYRRERQYLLEYFKSPEAVWQASAQEIGKLPFLKEGQREKLIAHQKTFLTEQEYHKWRDKGIRFISCENPEYPKKLRAIGDYPYGLFVKGQVPREQERCIAVIGARMCSNYGRNMARELAAKLAQGGVSVVSGLAYGIDACAQEACLEAGGKSYGILGCGADICYPREHGALYAQMALQGGVISEYPPGTKALPFHFPMRNRIISGMAELVVVVEAKKKSGSLITADTALEQGRDVFAFPGRIGDALSAGCNSLIAQGAGIITAVDAFLEENGILSGRMKKNENRNNMLAEAENMVYSCLDSRPKSLQTIAQEADCPVNQVMGAISALLMKGFAQEISKNHYVKK